MDRGRADAAEVLDEAMRVDETVRKVDSIEVDEATLQIVERKLDDHRGAIAEFYGIDLSGREGASFLRYREGGFYRRHIDCGDVPSWPEASRRRIAVVVFLNASFAGGALRLFGDELSDVQPRAGALVAFPADLPHEVLRVESGTRDTVVDWYY
jgi:predicted 2-oxoglutarate/Fe(II)-dependent dioxygenase YbiX